MKQIYDRNYPVTSILLIITSLVFALMFLFYGFQYSSTEALYRFGAVHGYTIQEMPIEFWRVFAAIFVHIGLEHFCGQYAYSVFPWPSDRRYFRTMEILNALSHVWGDGESIRRIFFTKQSGCRSLYIAFRSLCVSRRSALCHTKPLSSAVGAILYEPTGCQSNHEFLTRNQSFWSLRWSCWWSFRCGDSTSFRRTQCI